LSGQRDLVRLCEIVGAQGLKGEVKVRTYTASPDAIGDYGPLTDESGRLFELVSVRPGGKGVVARFKGVTTREAAEALRGVALFVSREALPETGEDEWYHSDLLGLAALGPGDEALGEVVGVLNFGAGDIIELKRDGEKETRLLPFTAATVIAVDLVAGIIRLAPPEDE
jgi:16S rRNA processing protein RimM